LISGNCPLSEVWLQLSEKSGYEFPSRRGPCRESGETHTNFHPYAGGDDRVRGKFPALPISAEADEHRRSQLYVHPHLLWRRRTLAHYEDAQRGVEGNGQLAICPCALRLCRGIFICL